MSSLGMGLPSYNCYVGLCAFLYVKTKKYINTILSHTTL